jgi:hypothetical protein
MRKSNSKKVHNMDLSIWRLTQNSVTNIPGSGIMTLPMASGKNEEFHDIEEPKKKKA